MTRPVAAVVGRALISTLGPDLSAAVAALDRRRPPEPSFRSLAPGERWPHYRLKTPTPPGDWYTRAADLVDRAMYQAGAFAHRDAPLFLASSSINVGAAEQAVPGDDNTFTLSEGGAYTFGGDCLAFAERLAGWLDWRGPVYWVNTACTSAHNALASARRLIVGGEHDQAVVLGFEYDNRYSGAGFAALQLLARQSPRPLAADRDGLVLGEAVAVLRLAAAPGEKSAATPLSPPEAGNWRLTGAANLVDGADPAGASETAVTAMTLAALADAGLAPGEIDLIKVQAAGSPRNDAAEIAGLRAVYAAASCPLPPLVSLKPWLGHTLGASGAAELALLLAAIDGHRWPAPPAASPDPALGAVLAERAPTSPQRILSIILGFGGGHAALVAERGGS